MRGNGLIRLIKLILSSGIVILLVYIFASMQMFFSLKNDATEQTKKLIKRDWHDYEAMHHDAVRIGIGEQGKFGALSDTVDRDLEKKMIWEEGFNALLSDAISVNRSLPDIRDKACLHKKYLAKLPTISVIIPFYNEYLSVLLRTVHSIVNRTPPELLKEIILVDDCSDRAYLFQELDNYVAEHFSNVRIVRLSKRRGLIRARVAGARKAVAEVLVIFDSHIEVTFNWLPPLIEPIALNKRTVVCPLIDVIAYTNFGYHAQYVEPHRGGFDWSFRFVNLKLSTEELKDRTKPFKNPVMAGGLFAISTEFFWELGGYDEGLDVWGGENYELSFKIWMCGGQMFDAPCSRVGHIFRYAWAGRAKRGNTNYVFTNYKRVAEVWMDEFKNYLYERNDGVFEEIDAGDLTKQKALREKLHCKPFRWFMHEVASDQLKEYPPVEPQDYAYGALQNVGSSNLCVDSLNRPHKSQTGLYPCSKNLTHPQTNQRFAISWLRDLRMRRTSTCLDVPAHYKNAPVFLWRCHGQGGNQFWYYDRKSKWLIHGRKDNYCLEASPSNFTLYMNICQKDNRNMQWNFGVVNETALDSFYENI